MNRSLSDFVHDALSHGVSHDSIIQALQRGGWTPKEISAALDAFVECDLPLPVPRKRASTSPKEAFLFLMLFAALYAAAVQLGSILFDLINLSLPQPGELPQYSIASLRYGMASVIVAFPTFLFMGRVIAKENLRNPGQRISPIRSWLTYLTLFVASVSIIGDLIALIVRFLEGDITLRFGLKIMVVAVLAGCVLAYYLRDVRRDEAVPSAEFGLTRASRVGLAVLIATVVVTTGFAFWFAGSPTKARLLAQDSLRVQDLANITRQVQSYYIRAGTLPESLVACDVNPGTFIEQKQDRVTGEPYIYRVIDATHFEVGASFSHPSESEDSKPASVSRPEAGFWEHGVGPETFRVDVKNLR